MHRLLLTASVAAILMGAGTAGASADTDRDTGFKRAMAEYPGISIAQGVFTGRQQEQSRQPILDLISTGTPFDVIWTSGIDNVIVGALIESDAPLVPVVGADNAGFVGQLANVEGLAGTAVTSSMSALSAPRPCRWPIRPCCHRRWRW